MNTFSILVFVLLLWASFYAIYFNFARRVILTRFKFSVAAVKDGMDLLVIAGDVSPEDEALKILRRRAENAERSLAQLNVTNFLLALSHGSIRTTQEVLAENATINSSKPELRALSDKLDTAVAGSFAANSPALLGFGIVILIGVAVFSAFAKGLQASLTASFWSTVYIGNGPNAGDCAYA